MYFNQKLKIIKQKEFAFFFRTILEDIYKKKWGILLTYQNYKLKVRFNLLKWFFVVIQNKIQNKLFKGN